MKMLLKLFLLNVIPVFFSISNGFGQPRQIIAPPEYGGNNNPPPHIYFCNYIDSTGYLEGQNSLFILEKDNNEITVYVSTAFPCLTKHVYYNIYRIDSRGNKTFEKSVEMDTESDWRWFSKEIAFNEAGTYNVLVKDEDNYPIVSGVVKISFSKMN